MVWILSPADQRILIRWDKNSWLNTYGNISGQSDIHAKLVSELTIRLVDSVNLTRMTQQSAVAFWPIIRRDYGELRNVSYYWMNM